VSIKKGDLVTVIAGGDKGKKGKVLYVSPQSGRAIVEGLRLVKKHIRRSSQDKPGGIVEKESPIHMSNLLLFCRKCNTGSRIGRKKIEGGERVRFCRRCEEVIGK
jgi:large subunit ribosomal protein L24